MGLLSGDFRHKRASSWKARAEGDLDTQFIFLWIAFNALYGQARYRNPGASWSEIGDITQFLAVMSRLDRRIAAITKEKDLKDIPRSKLFEIDSNGLRFQLVASSHPFADSERARDDLLRVATIAGIRGEAGPW